MAGKREGMRTIKQHGVLAWGKVRRLLLTNIFRRRAAGDLARRRGACTNCGACCQLLLRCPAFKPTPTGGWCTIYNDRPGVCAVFPINEKDLRDRDIIMPGRSCGFYFVKNENGLYRPKNGTPDMAPIKEPLRKLKKNPRRRKIVKNTLAIILAGIRRSA